MSNHNQGLSNDIATLLFDTIYELVMVIFKIAKKGLKFVIKKILKTDEEQEKIDRKQLKVKKKTDCGAYLGIDTKTKKPIWNIDLDFRRHSFIVGASGFGKTNLITLLQEHTLKANKPIVFIDPKGDLGALTSFKSLCETWGRKCYIFSEHYENSISLNPLRDGSINQICDRIMGAYEWTEPFYEDCARRALNQVLKKIKSDKKVITLKRIYDELKEIEDKNNIGIVTKLESILESDFGPILSDDDAVSFSEIREEKACVYIGLSTQGYPKTARAVGKFFLGDLTHNSYSALKKNYGKEAQKNPFSIFIDEFGAVVTQEFIELQNKCRDAGIEITVAMQTTSDINKVDPELTSQIFECASNIFVLKQRLDSSASYFSDSIGTFLTKKKTVRFEDDEQTDMGSEREVHELIVHPDIIKNLRIGQCVLLRHNPTQVNLVNLREAKTLTSQKKEVTQVRKTSKAF